MKTKLFTLLAALLCVATSWAGPSLSGSGTKDGPYLIGSLKDWREFAIYVGNNHTPFDECFKLTADIGPINDINSDLLEGTSFNRDYVLPLQLKEADRWLVGTYDYSTNTDIVNNFFMTSTCPLLLYYVKDDPWSAGLPSRVGPNVKMVINPIGRHSSWLNDPNLCPEATKQEVMNYVSTYIY